MALYSIMEDLSRGRIHLGRICISSDYRIIITASHFRTSSGNITVSGWPCKEAEAVESDSHKLSALVWRVSVFAGTLTFIKESG